MQCSKKFKPNLKKKNLTLSNFNTYEIKKFKKIKKTQRYIKFKNNKNAVKIILNILDNCEINASFQQKKVFTQRYLTDDQRCLQEFLYL